MAYDQAIHDAVTITAEGHLNRHLRPRLEGLVNNGVITPDGRDWLLESLDPFHDYQHHFAGYPDSNGARSVIERFTDQVTVSAPVGLAVGETWECVVFNNNSLNYRQFNGATYDRFLTVKHSNLDAGGLIRYHTGHTHDHIPLYPLSILSHRTSAVTDMVPQAVTAAGVTWQVVLDLFESTGLQAIPSAVQGKRMRLVGQGFEVHNTSPDLYKSGSVTVGRVPNTDTMDTATFENHAGGAAVNIVSAGTVRCNAPPANVDESIRYPDATTWEAKHGVYAHCSMASSENPIEAAVCQHTLMRTEGDLVGVGLSSLHNQLVAGSTAGYVSLAGQTNYTNTNMHYAYFSGLHLDTTLNVMLRTYTEHVPRVGDALLPLATPSAPLDTNALNIYSQAINHLPPAVMVSMNARGKYAKMIADVIAAIAPVAGAFLGPEAALAGEVVAAGIRGVAKAKQNQSKIRAPKNMPAKQQAGKKGPTSAAVKRKRA